MQNMNKVQIVRVMWLKFLLKKLTLDMKIKCVTNFVTYHIKKLEKNIWKVEFAITLSNGL